MKNNEQVFCFIYKTTNLINNKIYVGKHFQYETSAFDGYLGGGVWIKRVIKKYGKENFIRETIEYCPSDNINEREMYWISELSATNPLIGYNITNGGEGANGYKITQEDKIKMSKAHKGNKLTQDHRNKISESLKGEKSYMYGTKHSEDRKRKMSISKQNMTQQTKLKMREAKLGKKLSQEHKIKISESNKGKKISEETKIKICDSLKGKKKQAFSEVVFNGIVFSSMRKCCRENNITRHELKTMLKEGLILKKEQQYGTS